MCCGSEVVAVFPSPKLHAYPTMLPEAMVDESVKVTAFPAHAVVKPKSATGNTLLTVTAKKVVSAHPKNKLLVIRKAVSFPERVQLIAAVFVPWPLITFPPATSQK